MADALPWIAAAAVALYALHRLALWLEARDWLFYLNRRPSTSGSTGELFLGVNALIDSSAAYRQEAKRLDEGRESERLPDDLDRDLR